MNTKAKNTKKISGTSLIALIVSIVLVIAFVLLFIFESGLLVRAKKYAQSENFEVNGPMMQYFYSANYSTWYNQIGYYYIYYGLIDSETSFKEQYVDEEKTESYFDYFTSMTASSVSEMLKYCEAAKADPDVDFKQYEKNAKAQYDAAIDEFETLIKENPDQGYTVDYLIKTYYGEYMTKKDLKAAIRLQSIYNDYYSELTERFKNATTDEERDAHFAAHLDTFVTAEYLTISLTSPATPSTVNPDDYEGGKDSEEYKAKVELNNSETKTKNEAYKLDDLEFVEKLKAAKTAEEFKKLILEYSYNKAFSDAYTAAVKEFSDADKPAEDVKNAFRAEIKDKVIEAILAGKSDIELNHNHAEGETLSKWEEASHTLAKAVITNLNKVITDATKSTGYALKTDFDKFLFGGVKAQYGIDYADGEEEGTSAKVGDIKVLDEVTKEESGEYKLTVYFVTKEAARDDSEVRNVGHILVNFEENANDASKAETKKKAQAIFDELAKGAKKDGDLYIVDRDVFAKLGAEKTEDSNVFYSDVSTSTNFVQEYKDWLFAAKKVGQIGLIESTYGWHVMYYDGNGVQWESTATSSITNEKLGDWFDALTYEVSVDESVFAGKLFANY